MNKEETGATGEEPTEKGAPVPTANAELSTIADDISATAPEPQQHAIDEYVLGEQEKVAQFSHLVDSDGASFDPELHVTDANGEPKLTATGKLRKKPGRKSADKSSPSIRSTVASAPAPDPEAQSRATARASGKVTARMLIGIGCMFGGDEWQPKIENGYNEGEYLENAFADYFEATGKDDIPPGMALSVAVLAYAAPRFAMPKTRSRVGGFLGSIKKWWINRKIKKYGLEAVERGEKKGE